MTSTYVWGKDGSVISLHDISHVVVASDRVDATAATFIDDLLHPSSRACKVFDGDLIHSKLDMLQ